MNLTPCPLLINGEWLAPALPGTPVFDPSTGDVIAECRLGKHDFTPRLNPVISLS